MERILSVVVLGLLAGQPAIAEPGSFAVGCYVDGEMKGDLDDYGYEDWANVPWDHAYEDGEGGVWEGCYVDGKRHGDWVVLYDVTHPPDKIESEALEARGFYVDGKRHGKWIITYANDGDVWEVEGLYVDGKRHGHWTHYGDPDRSSTEECPNMENGPYVDGKRHGHWYQFYQDGRLRDGLYADGKKHGRWVWQHLYYERPDDSEDCHVIQPDGTIDRRIGCKRYYIGSAWYPDPDEMTIADDQCGGWG